MYSMTLNEIRQYSPCQDGWHKLLRGMGKIKADDTEIDLLAAYKIFGLENAVWALKGIPKFKVDARIYNVLCAEHVPVEMREVLFVKLCEGKLEIADIEPYEAPPPDYLPKDE